MFISKKRGQSSTSYIVRTNTSTTELEALINLAETELLNQKNKLKLLKTFLGEFLMQLIISHQTYLNKITAELF